MTGKLGRYTIVLAFLVVAIVAIAVGLLATLMQSSAARIDAQQLETETVIVRSVIRRQIAKLEGNVRDYALWDDMYDRFANGTDPQWDIENLGPYGITTFQLTHISVLAADGRLAYDHDAKTGRDKTMRKEDLARLAKLAVPAIADARRGKFRVISGVLEFDGWPHFVAIHPIWVASVRRKASGEAPDYALVYLKALDETYLGVVASDFNFQQLGVTVGGGMVSLAGPENGSPVFGLSWRPSNGGQQFISDSLPLLLGVAPLVAALLIALAFGWAGLVSHARDSEMRSAEARAQSAEETSRAKSMFIANMSHELRTPLNAINGFSEFLKGDMLELGIPDKYREYAGDIHQSGQHLLRIVNNLLLFSKIEARQHKTHVETLCLNEEISATFRMLNMVAAQRGVRLTCPTIDKSLMIRADQQSFAQIVVNVVANAVKFSPRGEEVVIEHVISPTGGTCELRVIDHGCGIPEKTLAQLGQPFVQAEGVYTRREQGTGLGLAICFALAEQMGAKLTIFSTEGVGTTVSLLVPLGGVAPIAETPPAAQPKREIAAA